MKKESERRKLGMVLVSAVLFVTLAFVSVGCASAATHYVNPGESIQAAVNAADPYDTIIVKDGTYTENVNVNKRLTIRSENGSASTIVQAASRWDHVFEVSANYVNISGFTVRESSEGKGIYLGNGVIHCTISNNTALSNSFGIYLYYSENNTISSNIALGNGQGILLYSSNSNTISGNTASDNGDTGIYLSSSCNNNTISRNTVSGNIKGIWVYASSNNNNISGNTVTNNDYDGIWLEESSDNTISGNTASNNRFGVRLALSCNYNNISSNTASDNFKGIQLYDSCNYNNISSNTVTNTDYEGISLFYSSNNLIYNNYFNNTKNAWDNGNNIWNISKTEGTNTIGGPHLGGNYWSDYTGEDLDEDGVGDTPYDIPGSSNKDYLPLTMPAPKIFDTGEGTYPSIMGTHKGEIKPSHNINVSKLYTYACVGTGGHTESIKLYENGIPIANGTWNGYQSDWHNITIHNISGAPYVILYKDHKYNYTIITGSYPQIHHTDALLTANGWINCTEFIDANGKRYDDWIPAIRLEGKIEKIGCEYIFEDFNDMITVTDTGFNDFSGNMGIVNKDDVPYIETPLNISSLSQDGPGGSLRISYDFIKDDDEEAFTGIFMSLFGHANFSNYTIDFKNIFGELQEAPKDFDCLRFYVRGDPANENKIMLRVELKDNKNSIAYHRIPVPDVNESWKEVEIPIYSFNGIDNVDRHHMKLLNFIIERNNYADNIHNPDKGTFYLDNIRFVDRDDYPKSLDEMSDDQFLDLISKRAFQYFLDWSSKDERSKGLIQDRSTSNDLLTIGGTGFYLTAMPIGVERGWISREEARRKVKETLEILANDSLQGPERVGKIGYKGFFYHFLGIDGKRKINFDYPDTPENESLNTVELSTIDTALCLYGVLTCKEYFNDSHPDEMAIRDLADHIYKRVEWDFMLEPNSSQFYWGWKPNEERKGDPYEIPDGEGFGNYSGNMSDPSTMDNYTDEVYLVSLLAIGSPTHPVSPDVFCSWKRKTDECDFVKSYTGSLFTYFFASLWINTGEWGTDVCNFSVNWHENSQKAILSSRNYCINNSENFSTYGENSWGLTACEGSDDKYRAYGAPPCALNVTEAKEKEDGTIAPYGVGSVITFGDELANYSISALKHYYQDTDLWRNRFGFGDAYNLDVSEVEGINGSNIIRNTGSWYNHVGFAIDNGPLLIAIENYQTGLIGNLIGQNKNISSAIHKVYTIYTRECEYPDEYTVGHTIPRAGASGSKVHGQFGCEGSPPWSAKEGYVKYNLTDLYDAEHLYLVLRYSKWSPNTTSIEIFLDEEVSPRESFIPENQGSWINFAETDPIDLGNITDGNHTIKFSTKGQQYGVADLDKFTLRYVSK